MVMIVLVLVLILVISLGLTNGSSRSEHLGMGSAGGSALRGSDYYLWKSSLLQDHLLRQEEPGARFMQCPCGAEGNI